MNGHKKSTFFRRAPEVLPILVSSEISSAVQWCTSPSLGQNKYYSNQHWEIWTWINIENILALSWQIVFLFCLFLRHNTGENYLDLTLKKMDHLNLYFWPASQGFRTDGIDRTLWDSARLVTLYPSLLDIKTQVPVSASTLLCQRGQLHTAEQTIKLSKQ